MKQAILQISAGLLTEILTGFKDGFNGHFKVFANGLPKDAQPVQSCGNIHIIVESESFKDISEDEHLPTLEPVRMQAIEVKDDILWLCGQFRKETAFGYVWDFQGMFHIRDDAIKACNNENYFVTPVEVGKELPEEVKDWSVIEYPLRDENAR
jgi:hypothetical protein